MKVSRCVWTCAAVWNALLFLCGESFVLSAADLPSARRTSLHSGGIASSSSSSHLQHCNCNRMNQHERSQRRLYLVQRGGALVDTPAAVVEDTTTTPASIAATTETEKKEEPQQNEQLPKNHIQVSSQIDLPFSAEIAFDAFSDLPRQSSWSTWLTSVQYVQGSNNNNNKNNRRETKWTMKSILGVKYSWHAISTRLERPHVIEWESCKGLQNWGRVEFIRLADRNSNDTTTTSRTRMQLTLTFVAPRIIARLFQNQNGGLSRMVQRRIVGGTLQNFRRIVLAEDVVKAATTTEKKDDKQIVVPPLGPPRERYQSIVKDRP